MGDVDRVRGLLVLAAADEGLILEGLAALDRLERERDTLREALETTQCTMPVSLFGVAAAPCVLYAEANPSMPVTICDRCAALAAVSGEGVDAAS